jgi:hypothetical protein
MKKNYKQIIAFIALTFTICTQVTAQDIEFTFENSQNTNDGTYDYYEVDVMIKTINSTADFKLGSGQLYFTYNTAAFGENVKANNTIETSQANPDYICGQDLDAAAAAAIYGTFTVNDNTTNRVSWAFSQTFSSSTFAANNVTSAAKKLMHLKFKYTDVMEDPMVAFEDSDVFDDQFFTACGPDSGGPFESADCSNHAGTQLMNDSFNSLGSTLSTTDVLLTENDVKIYPNPVKDVLQIRNTTEIQIDKVEIYNMLGKRIKVIQKPQKSINVSQLSKGIYLLYIISENGKTTKRIMKK